MWLQPVETEQASVVQTLPSSQSTVVWLQPADVEHASIVHAFASSHEHSPAPGQVKTCRQPEPVSQLSELHGSRSSQSAGFTQPVSGSHRSSVHGSESPHSQADCRLGAEV